MRLEEVEILGSLEQKYPDNPVIPYYFGNLLYYIGQRDRGLAEWHKAVDMDPSFSLACRNVGFGEGQKGNYAEALKYYDMAIAADPSDPMLFTESDKICEKSGMDAKARMKRLESNLKTVMKHDDAVMRLLQTYNETGNYDKAIKIMDTRHFHLWEGGGSIHNIYVTSHILKGQSYLDKKKYDKALKEFDLATLYPENLEVPAPAGKNVTLESMLKEMQDDLNDNYAKFGDSDKAASQKRIEELKKLLEIIKKR
jgi:tetratricopeptide (TPR) repeat protein